MNKLVESTLQREKLTVIIPVHNGDKVIQKTVTHILKQDYPNFEVILVENFSSDESLEECRKLERLDSRVICVICDIKGTSQARKKGIMVATGRYIVFCDQDDSYISTVSLRHMVEAIEEDQAQICQFGFYRKYPIGLRKKVIFSESNQIFDRNQLMRKEIIGVLGQKSSFHVTVWSKIYATDVLKAAVENNSYELYFAEDMCLNILAFFNEKISRVSVRNEAYYVWNVGVGFSASNRSGLVLFDEYEIVKQLGMSCAERENISKELLIPCHIESLYLQKVLVCEEIKRQVSRTTIEQEIEKLGGEYQFILQAKNEVSKLEDTWEELRFLAGEYTASEYYDWCLQHPGEESKWKRWIKRILYIGG